MCQQCFISYKKSTTLGFNKRACLCTEGGGRVKQTVLCVYLVGEHKTVLNNKVFFFFLKRKNTLKKSLGALFGSESRKLSQAARKSFKAVKFQSMASVIPCFKVDTTVSLKSGLVPKQDLNLKEQREAGWLFRGNGWQSQIPSGSSHFQ